MKKLLPILLTTTFLVTLSVPTNASWLSKTWDKLTSPISQSSVDSVPNQKSERWIKVEENSFYTTYIDKRTFKAEGKAQSRYVTGFFKREFTPIGSQWLGNQSHGRIKPDTIKYSIYEATYGVNSCHLAYTGNGTPLYYDVNGNLLYQGRDLIDISYQSFGNYIPDSMQEKLKDRLFHAVGWDY